MKFFSLCLSILVVSDMFGGAASREELTKSLETSFMVHSDLGWQLENKAAGANCRATRGAGAAVNCLREESEKPQLGLWSV